MNDIHLLKEIQVKYNTKKGKEYKIKSSNDVKNWITDIIGDELNYREHFYMICLNRSQNIIGWYKLSMGGTSNVVIDNKIIFSIALNCLASGIILIHNHPSGNINPSKEDIKITKRLKEAGKLLDITILDHVIISSKGHYSFADENIL